MREPLVLYSTNTLLAYRINQQYYDEIHFAWCSPYFSGSADSIDAPMPPSSTPCDLCHQYLHAIQRQDRHSLSIRNNRTGLEKGTTIRKDEGIITPEQHQEISKVIETSSLADFRPLLYVIPFAEIRELVRPARPDEKAHPFSREYIIERLPRSRFDVLDWQWR